MTGGWVGVGMTVADVQTEKVSSSDAYKAASVCGGTERPGTV